MKKYISALCAVVMLTMQLPTAGAEGLSINAASALLMEASTGEILYESNPDEQLAIASVTKIMTMLLIMEALDSQKIAIDEIVTGSDRAKSMGGSTMFLDSGEQLPVHDMLKGIAVASANDGCVAMAEHISGSEEGFVELMNSRAAELGMKNTHFVNSNGLDDDNHYSSARDVALMSRELIKHEKIFEYTTIWTDSLREGKFALANTNKLIRFYRGANGLKTGSTSKAKCCLAATAMRNDMQLIAVVLGAPTSKDRFAAASSLLDYGFANYSVYKGAALGEELAQIRVMKGVRESVTATTEEDICILLKKGSENVERELELCESITAPVAKGDILGKIKFVSEGNVLREANLVSNEDINKKGFGLMLADVLRNWICGCAQGG